MNTECERLEDRHGNKYLLIMDFAWSVPRSAPLTKSFLRNEKRELIAFNEVAGYFPDAIEWAKCEIAAMTRRGGNHV